MDEVQERMKGVVDELDDAWLNGEASAYAPRDANVKGFSESVRYAHIFFRTGFGLSLLGIQDAVPLDDAKEAISLFEASWKPVDPSAAQGYQVGRYDDSLTDEAVRVLHLAMKSLLAKSLAMSSMKARHEKNR